MFKVYLYDVNGNALALTPDPDAPQVFSFDTIRDFLGFIVDTKTGWTVDDDCVAHSGVVAGYTVYDGPTNITAEVPAALERILENRWGCFVNNSAILTLKDA